MRDRAHVRFDVVLSRVGPMTKGVLYIIGELATIVFACIALYWSTHPIQQLLHFEGTTPVLRVNKAWFEAAVPIGFALVIWRSVQALRRDVRNLLDRTEPYVGKTMFEE